MFSFRSILSLSLGLLTVSAIQATSASAIELDNMLYRLTVEGGGMSYLPNNGTGGTVISSGSVWTGRYVKIRAVSGAILAEGMDWLGGRWQIQDSSRISVYGLNRATTNVIRVGVAGRSGVSFQRFCLKANDPTLYFTSANYSSGSGSNRFFHYDLNTGYGFAADVDLPSGGEEAPLLVDVAPGACDGWLPVGRI